MELNRQVLTILFVFVAIGLSVFLVYPKYNEFKYLQISLIEDQAELNSKYDYFAEVTKTYDQLETSKDSLSKIEGALSSNTSLSPLMYTIQKKSIESGLIVRNLFLSKVSPVDTKTGLKEIVFSVNLIGSYSALKNFSYSLEKSSGLFAINTVSFSSPVSFDPTGQQSSQQIQSTYPFDVEIKVNSY